MKLAEVGERVSCVTLVCPKVVCKVARLFPSFVFRLSRNSPSSFYSPYPVSLPLLLAPYLRFRLAPVTTNKRRSLLMSPTHPLMKKWAPSDQHPFSKMEVLKVLLGPPIAEELSSFYTDAVSFPAALVRSSVTPD